MEPFDVRSWQETTLATFRDRLSAGERRMFLDELLGTKSQLSDLRHVALLSRTVTFDLLVHFPAEILVHIFRFLSDTQLARIRAVSRAWRDFVDGHACSILWRRHGRALHLFEPTAPTHSREEYIALYSDLFRSVSSSFRHPHQLAFDIEGAKVKIAYCMVPSGMDAFWEFSCNHQQWIHPRAFEAARLFNYQQVAGRLYLAGAFSSGAIMVTSIAPDTVNLVYRSLPRVFSRAISNVCFSHDALFLAATTVTDPRIALFQRVESPGVINQYTFCLWLDMDSPGCIVTDSYVNAQDDTNRSDDDNYRQMLLAHTHSDSPIHHDYVRQSLHAYIDEGDGSSMLVAVSRAGVTYAWRLPGLVFSTHPVWKWHNLAANIALTSRSSSCTMFPRTAIAYTRVRKPFGIKGDPQAKWNWRTAFLPSASSSALSSLAPVANVIFTNYGFQISYRHVFIDTLRLAFVYQHSCEIVHAKTGRPVCRPVVSTLGKAGHNPSSPHPAFLYEP